MAKKYSERSLMDFQKTFSTEEACAKHLIQQRWPDGFVCPHCGHKEAWYLSKRKLFDCMQCRFRTSLTSGTVFHKSRVSLVKWYWLIFYMAMNKVGVSISQMQRLLEISDYKTVWLMAHKVRKGMVDRDSQYKLAGLVEMDDSFFGPQGKIRGRGSEKKKPILCAVSLYRDRNGKERAGFAHMSVVDDVSSETVESFLERLGCGSKTEEGRKLLNAIRTDGWRSYGKVANNKDMEHCKVVLRNPGDAGKLLPWVHRVISNAKSVIRGAHRGVSNKHLQNYLSEICYRFNRRFWERELFDRLVQACVTTNTITYKELVGGRN